MLAPETLLRDLHRLLEERLDLGILALVAVQLGEVVQALGKFGIVRAQDLLRDRHCAVKERLGLGILPLRRVDHGQVSQALGDVLMHRAEHLLPDPRQPRTSSGMAWTYLPCL